MSSSKSTQYRPFANAIPRIFMDDTDEEGQNDPQLEKPAVLNTAPNGLEVNSMTYSINDKSLGAGEPIRVNEGQRILLHLLNASAIENRRIALPGHKFKVIALDGNPVPSPQLVETLFLGAGERIASVRSGAFGFDLYGMIFNRSNLQDERRMQAARWVGNYGGF